MDQDRRAFLKQSGRYILLTGAATVAWDYVVKGEAQAAPNYTATDHWWGMTIDIDKCIGSGNCVRACKAENDVPLEDGCFRTWVERYRVDPEAPEHPLVDSPHGGYDGFPPIDNPGDRLKTFFVPKMCNQCVDSPCTQVCPVGATFHSPDGVVLIDKTRCLGCRYCVQACPYGCRYIDPRTHTADKCTLCYHRITKGLTTACAEACPTGARQLVDLKNPKDPVHDFIRDHKIHVLKPQMATRAKVFYNGLDGSVR
jgi:tetrathionate reductase subunit B